MMVGALIDAGADLAGLERAVAGLGLSGYRIGVRRKDVSGIAAVKFDVKVSEAQPERHLGEIDAMIDRAGLSARTTRDAHAIFAALAAAEAKVHRTSPDQVHFHEVGAVDSIIDIVGTAWALEQLEVAAMVVSGLPMGTGFARSRHGVIPVPAPATAELLAGFPLRLGDGPAEMVTPTGAAIVKALARPAPPIMNYEIDRIGYGAGARQFADRPNLLRLILGRASGEFAVDELVEVAANIDDLNPQIYGHVSDRLFAAGARDVTITPTIMKKGRPGVTLAVLAEARARDEIARVIFAETSTIGLRFHPVARLKLERRVLEVDTRFGKLRVKVAGADGGAPQTVAPEYDDCRVAALEYGTPIKLVIEEALAAARRALD
ncbi:MAG: nickel pincer cofactor biosynthesis protein LarC [Candidatus Binataceae bacterium]|nr:nickel pincer cofactor biosynthesis protein LarC [Candidatus Binataceae bacterium]